MINISSIGGFTGYAGWGLYNATKFALEGLSEGLHADLAPLGVRATIDEPGSFRTDFLDRSSLQAELHVIADYAVRAGETGVVTVDGLLQVPAADEMRAGLDTIGKPLQAALVTRSHPDHYAGLGEIDAGYDVPIFAPQDVIDTIAREEALKTKSSGRCSGTTGRRGAFSRTRRCATAKRHLRRCHLHRNRSRPERVACGKDKGTVHIPLGSRIRLPRRLPRRLVKEAPRAPNARWCAPSRARAGSRPASPSRSLADCVPAAATASRKATHPICGGPRRQRRQHHQNQTDPVHPLLQCETRERKQAVTISNSPWSRQSKAEKGVLA